MKKFVIYTVMVGGYDKVLQPIVTDERFDFILFSNDFNTEYVGVWKVRKISNILKNDNKRLSRYPKTQPELLLCDYEASLYIDANIQIIDQWVYDRFFELYNNRTEYAGIKLLATGKDCIYEHTLDICLMNAEHDFNAIVQCHALYVNNYPEHFGLNENNIIFRIHTDRMKNCGIDWWWWITNYSFRDQFSYMYCIWKNNININYFLPVGEDAHNSTHFRIVKHSENTIGQRKKWLNKSLMERLRSNFFREFPVLSNRIWKYSYKQKHCKLTLITIGNIVSVFMLPLLLIRLLMRTKVLS